MLIASALMLGSKEPVGEAIIDIFRAADLQKVRLIENVRAECIVWRVVSNIKAQADASVRRAVMAPEQEIIPVAVESKEAIVLPKIDDKRVHRMLDTWLRCIEGGQVERVVEVIDRCGSFAGSGKPAASASVRRFGPASHSRHPLSLARRALSLVVTLGL